MAEADPGADRGDLDRRSAAFAEGLRRPTWESGAVSGRTQGCLVSGGSITSDKDRWPDDRRSLPTDGPTLARPSADKSRGRLPKEPASKLSR